MAERIGPPSFILHGATSSQLTLGACEGRTAGGHRWKQVGAEVTSGDEVVILGLRVAAGLGASPHSVIKGVRERKLAALPRISCDYPLCI